MGWVEILVSVLLPVVVALVTKEVAAPGVKAVALAVLAAAAAVAQGWIDNGVLTEVVLQDAVRNFVVAVATYYGLWKPVGVTSTIQHKTESFGLG